METEFIIVAVPIFFHAIATFYGAFEAHQMRKSNLLEIVHFHQARFDDLLESSKDLLHIIEAPKIDLEAIKKKNAKIYDRLFHWAERYFWLCFDEWLEGHVWKSVPKYISKKEWDEGIIGAMQQPFFRQMWRLEFRGKNFRAQKRFNKFIDSCITRGQG